MRIQGREGSCRCNAKNEVNEARPYTLLGSAYNDSISRARSSEFFIFPLLYLVLQHGDTEQCGLMNCANERAN
jgi:hypothetical protein